MKNINNKGFTLVELIATIVVLAMVMGIGSYAITNIINNSKKENYKLLITNIYDAVELYYQECKYVSDTGICDSEITLGYLVTNGHLKGNDTNSDDKYTLVNPNDNVDISSCEIIYTYSDGKFTIEDMTNSGSCPTTSDYSSYK